MNTTQTLELVAYLQQNGLQKLQDEYSILVRRHSVYPNLVLLKYDQLKSPMGEKVVQQCRGIILDEAADWRVIACPYFKFFNSGEGHAVEIDWNSAVVQEKLDGSLMTLYRYDDNWHVASSGSPDASGLVYGTDMTFAQLFWQTFHNLEYDIPDSPDYCYMFELMTEHNRVVVAHEKPRLVLHGMRVIGNEVDENYLREFPPDEAAALSNWECVKSYPLTSLDEVMEAAQHLKGIENEGFVVVDDNFNRIKVKSPAYVALHHLRDSFCTRRLVEIVRTNEGSEFLAYFPDFKAQFEDVQQRYNALCSQLVGEYSNIAAIEDQKEFAQSAVRSRCSGALFALRNGKADSVEQFLQQMNIPQLMRILGLKDSEADKKQAAQEN